MFRVIGGEFKDTSFREIIPGTEESYGPFDNYQDAYMVWSGKARAQIDICCHRLEIKEAR